MKKVAVVILLAIMVCAAACAEGEIRVLTIQEFLDCKGEGECVMQVRVAEIINPVLALVEDDSGSVNMFGFLLNGEFADFDTNGIKAGDVLLIQNPKYNEYEGSVELADSVLLNVLRAPVTE